MTLSNPSATDITLTLTTADGSATAGTDYTGTTGSVTIAAGATSGTFSVAVVDDAIDESDETFTVSVQSVDAGTVGSTSDTGTGTITDNDGAPDVQIGDVTVDEAAGTATFAVTLSNPSASDITLTLTSDRRFGHSGNGLHGDHEFGDDCCGSDVRHVCCGCSGRRDRRK